ncbi:MAG: RNA-binding protein [Chlorobiaceae bacterium]|nr:RNA-binding protein [Chlorobiaceae bacterium]
MNIYIGNLDYGITEAELSQAFGEFGTVSRSNVIMDKMTGRSKGFGFVEMPNDAEANEAIANLNESVLNGRKIRVNEAQPKEQRAAPRARY